MKVLAMMAAIAITLGLNGTAEVWELPTDPEVNWVQTQTAPVVVEERACLIIPVITDEDGFVNIAPESEWVHTGGLAIADIRVGMVGHYLNIAFNPGMVDSFEMELSSIDLTGLSEVTICE